MGAQGTATMDFGSSTTLRYEAEVAITGQAGIVAGSLVEAWVRVESAGSADHSMDEHRIENLKITAGNIVPGVGFTIYGEITLGTSYGAFTVNWVWN